MVETRTRIITKVGFTMLSLAGLFAGCSACPVGRPHTPQLTEAEVIEIANKAAEASGEKLSNFRAPEAHFEAVEKTCTWSVFYEGIGSTIGNHFLVRVNDKTRRAEIFGGT